MADVQMCTVDDLTGGEPCLRVAQWVWRPSPADHPVHLCNYHADPLLDGAAGPVSVPGRSDTGEGP